MFALEQNLVTLLQTLHRSFATTVALAGTNSPPLLSIVDDPPTWDPDTELWDRRSESMKGI